MAKLTTAILFALVASCAQREDRICDMVVDGICVSIGNADLSGECISEALETVYRHYSEQYKVSFDPEQIAEDNDLYLMFRSEEYVKNLRGKNSDGFYVEKFDEITIVESRGPGVLLGHLAHEMLHFWNRNVLRYKRPELFRPSFDEAVIAHSAPHMFSNWCVEHKGEICVEDVVRTEILASDCGES